MSATDEWDEARIHAYVDGALDAFTAARLEAACRQDAMLNARVERQRRLRAQLGAAFDTVLDEPVPSRLLDALGNPPTATVTAIRGGLARTRVQPLWLGALAASLVIGLAVGWFAPRTPGLPVEAGSQGLLATGYLDTALSQALSSDERGSSAVQIALSFQTSDGRYCRSYTLASGADGLACRSGDRWHVEVLAPAPSGSSQDYRQASSALSGAVLAAIEEKQAGDSLDVEQERLARRAGWQGSGEAIR